MKVCGDIDKIGTKSKINCILASKISKTGERNQSKTIKST